MRASTQGSTGGAAAQEPRLRLRAFEYQIGLGIWSVQNAGQEPAAGKNGGIINLMSEAV